MSADKVPEPEASDAEDVVWALQTAATMWSRGDSDGTIRWLRKAAESASDAGDDMRALTLAKKAADLTALPPPEPALATSPNNPPILPSEDFRNDWEDTDYAIPEDVEQLRSEPPPPPSQRVTQVALSPQDAVRQKEKKSKTPCSATADSQHDAPGQVNPHASWFVARERLREKRFACRRLSRSPGETRVPAASGFG